MWIIEIHLHFNATPFLWPRIIVELTMDGVSLWNVASSVTEAMVTGLTICATVNVVELFVKTIISILQTILFLLSEHILCKESIVIVKKFDFEILTYLYVLRSPEFIYTIFAVMYACMCVCTRGLHGPGPGPSPVRGPAEER